MALVYLAFLIFIVLIYFAKTENMDCPVHQASSKLQRTYWGPFWITAVKVCITINWPVQKCSRAKESFVALNISHSSFTEVIRTNFTPAEIKGRFCEIFDPCRISKSLMGKNLTGVVVVASAEVFAFGEGPDKQRPSISFSEHSRGLRMHKVGETRRAVTHEFMSVVCGFPKCTIDSEGYGGDSKYYFKETEEAKRQAPLCVEKLDSDFSVTLFDCGLECGSTYNAVAGDEEIPPRLRPSTEITAPTDGDKVTPKITDTTDGDKVAPKITDTTDGDKVAPKITTPTDGDKVTQKITDTTDGDKIAPKITDTTDGDKVAPKITTPTDGDKVTQKIPTNGDKVTPKSPSSVDLTATTTKLSNAFPHLSIRTILIVAVLALLD